MWDIIPDWDSRPRWSPSKSGYNDGKNEKHWPDEHRYVRPMQPEWWRRMSCATFWPGSSTNAPSRAIRERPTFVLAYRSIGKRATEPNNSWRSVQLRYLATYTAHSDDNRTRQHVQRWLTMIVTIFTQRPTRVLHNRQLILITEQLSEILLNKWNEMSVAAVFELMERNYYPEHSVQVIILGLTLVRAIRVPVDEAIEWQPEWQLR